MTVEGQRYLEECRKVLKEEQMDAVSMGLDFGLPVSDIQKVCLLYTSPSPRDCS